MDNNFLRRMNELAERSQNRGIFTFSEFLSPSKQAEVTADINYTEISFYGGVEFAERKMARFGDEEKLFYSEDFPIKILKIETDGGKFSDEITHRDILGAVLNLGIERDRIGDIFTDGKTGYIVSEEKIAEFIIAELKKVGKNTVKTDYYDEIPVSFAPKTEEKSFTVASNRVDSIVSGVYNLSREKSAELFKAGKVLLNGKAVDKSKELKPLDVITVGGYGKFRFISEGGTSKKGKIYVKAERYI